MSWISLVSDIQHGHDTEVTVVMGEVAHTSTAEEMAVKDER